MEQARSLPSGVLASSWYKGLMNLRRPTERRNSSNRAAAGSYLLRIDIISHWKAISELPDRVRLKALSSSPISLVRSVWLSCVADASAGPPLDEGGSSAFC